MIVTHSCSSHLIVLCLTRDELLRLLSYEKPALVRKAWAKYEPPNSRSQGPRTCFHVRFVDESTKSGTATLFSPTEIVRMQRCAQRLHQNGSSVMVFSNLPLRAKQALPQATVIDEPDEVLSLYMLADCDVFVPSPSTFQWWAMFLHRKPGRAYLVWDRERYPVAGRDTVVGRDAEYENLRMLDWIAFDDCDSIHTPSQLGPLTS